jgi:4-hydroxy-tetrahydrodipicolinate synthase
MQDRFHGLFTATLTPFGASGEIDRGLLKEHFAQVMAVDGTRGVLCNGHAGENFLLSRDESRLVVECAARVIAGRGLVTAGVLAESTDLAVLMARDAEDAGADAVVVFPPFSWALSADPNAIVAHHRAIARAISIPLVLYMTSATAGHMHYRPDVLARLLEIETVVAIKEGSWNTISYERTRAIVQTQAPEVAVLASGDEVLYPSFVLGTEGSMVSLACIAGSTIAALLHAVSRDDHVRARQLHSVVQPLANAVYGRSPSSHAVLRLKAAMALMGFWPETASRLPAGRLALSEVEDLRRLLDRCGLLEAMPNE